jgi:ribosomal protein S18 acetylase RimI-like enzyme
MSLSIRSAVPSDFDDISNIVNLAFTPFIEVIGKTPRPMLEDYAELIVRGFMFVLLDNEAIEAVIMLRPEPDYLYLGNLAVHPNARKKGLGKQLMNFAEEHAYELGMSEIRLIVNEGMAYNLSYYANIGYLEVEKYADGDHKYMRRLFVKSLITQ